MYEIKYDLYLPLKSFEKYRNVNTELVLGSRTAKTPFFSIMIPTYKRADTIVLSVNSALNQLGFDDYEIVIVDNDPQGAYGETKEFLSQLKTQKMCYYVNQKNIGLCGNWNRCVEFCRGQYIVMLHDDDILSPYCLKTLYDVIIKTNNPTVLGVGYHIFQKDSVPDFKKTERVSFHYIEKEDFFWGESVNIAGLAFRRDFINSMGGFADEYYPNEDSYFIYQAIVHGQVVKIEQQLAGYRVENNLSIKGDTLKEIICMTEKMRENIALYESFAQRFMKYFDTEYLYEYIQGANQYWSQHLDCQQIFEACHMKRKKINFFKIVYIKIKLLFYKQIKLRFMKRYRMDIHW